MELDEMLTKEFRREEDRRVRSLRVDHRETYKDALLAIGRWGNLSMEAFNAPHVAEVDLEPGIVSASVVVHLSDFNRELEDLRVLVTGDPDDGLEVRVVGDCRTCGRPAPLEPPVGTGDDAVYNAGLALTLRQPAAFHLCDHVTPSVTA